MSRRRPPLIAVLALASLASIPDKSAHGRR